MAGVPQMFLGLPESWSVMPGSALLEERLTQARGTEENLAPEVVELVRGIASAVSDGEVSTVAFGRVRTAEGDLGCSVATRFDAPYDGESIDQCMERIAAVAREEGAVVTVVEFEAAGYALRLAWPRRRVTERLHEALCEYVVPYPGDEGVAIIATSAVGVPPDLEAASLFDALLADLSFAGNPQGSLV